MKPTDISAPDYFHKVVDCQWACPAHTPVPEYIRLIAAGRYSDAYMLNWKSNVFPGILGRTCDRPCEPACRRVRVEDEPVAICRLKRVAADYKDDIKARLPRPAAPGLPHGGKAGPAHVGAAADLGRAGRGLGPWRQAIAAGMGLLLLVLPFVLSTVFAAPAWALVTANTFLVLVLLAGLGFELRRAVRLATGNGNDIRDEGATPDMRASAAFSKASVLAKELRSLEERLDPRDIGEDSDVRHPPAK